MFRAGEGYRMTDASGTTTSLDEYIASIADTHGASGAVALADGAEVYAAYRDGDYELIKDGERLTDVEGDLTEPFLAGDRLLALLDEEGAERHDVVEVDPTTGAVSPVLADEHDVMSPLPNPADPSQLALVTTHHGSLDLSTYDLESGDLTRRSTTDRLVTAFDWSPDGDRLLYQGGLFDETAVSVVDLADGTETVLFDEPDSEQSLGWLGAGHHTWSTQGILVLTNHETGYREIAVGDLDGTLSTLYANEVDCYDARWTSDGAVLFLEANHGDVAVRTYRDGTVETLSDTGLATNLQSVGDSHYYVRRDAQSQGDVYRDGELRIVEGRVDVPTTGAEKVEYESFDGRSIPALRYRPEGEPRGAVVRAHGGPEAQHFNTLAPTTQALVRQGFDVLAADVRGSTGYGREFRKLSDEDLGGDDLTDLQAAAAYLRDDGHDFVGITGGSYGGYMTLMAVAATEAFDAGVSICGVVNWATVVEDARGYVGEALMRKLGGTPDERPEFYRERSPITHVDDIDVPLMIIQGANDVRVPESEAEQIVDSLAERDVPSEYLRFEDEGHGIVRSENRVEYITAAVEFFTRHRSSA